MKHFCYLLFLISTFATAQSNRKSIYPVILVHGLNSSDGTWITLMNEYRRAGYNVSIDGVRAGTGSRLDFNLNADGDVARATTDFDYQANRYNYGDVLDMQSSINATNDVFVLNFDNGTLSNQSGIYKQGFAVGIAIQKILAATKAEKVILVGHSMGGLAIREYLQNSRFLFYSDNAMHKVYKAVTIGTPHGGSNNSTSGVNAGYWLGVNERSEAVRDLRSNHVVSGQQGIYLWGGLETAATYGIFGQTFYNNDINCNGRLDEVAGINKAKAQFMPSDVYFDCVVTEYSNLGSDAVVTTTSQNMNSFILKQINGFSVPFADVIRIDNVLHTKQTEQSFVLIKSAMKTLNIPIISGSYHVFLTGNTNPNNSDKTLAFASYSLTVRESGKLSVDYGTAPGISSKLTLYRNNGSGSIVVSTIQAANVAVDVGIYYILAEAELNRDNYSTANLSIRFIPDSQPTNTNVATSSIVYPNPTYGFVQIKSKQTPTLINCYDSMGKSVKFKVENGGIYIEQTGLILVQIDDKTHKILVQ